MSKAKKPTKEKQPRPDKYAEKVAINIGFEDTLRLFADAANSNVTVKIEETTTELAEEM